MHYLSLAISVRAMLKVFIAAALAVLVQAAAAAGWEETYLVLQTDSGNLVWLEYSSEERDERAGIRRYANHGPDEKTKVTRCGYRDGENPRTLTCTFVNGKRVHQVFEEQASAGNNTALARRIYRRFVGDRLPSSVGQMHEEVFVCVAGCPEGQKSIAISITCAECGMEEDWCHRRYEAHPKLAFVASDEVNLRKAPGMTGLIVGKLRLNQALHIVEAKIACSEIQAKEGARVGRWIKVRTGSSALSAESWVFDVYVRYENEK